MKATLYHKPACGTCQKVLKALQDKGLEITAVDYLKTPPSPAELDAILKKLKMEPEDLVRKKEPLYQERFAGKTLSRAEWLNVLHENPVLIERPIVVLDAPRLPAGRQAVVARPPERLEDLFT
ncbi:MAG: hypothetical protein A2992_07405 [Elusimicrobia bacterium RIFCSPLOWO2_01_FULL_59_12]|nr:MAG: hypothetical protein A2992_07405 [Elusimicrobia bacterium RIFCSPLOWO2_01_FULL_59_12]